MPVSLLSATCEACRLCRCGRPFSPAQPWARRDAPFSTGRWRYQCSLQARSSPSPSAARIVVLEGRDALIRLVPTLGHFLTHPALPRRYAACPQPAEPRRSYCATASTGSYDAPSKLACCASLEGYSCRSNCARGGSTSLDFAIRLVPRAHSGSTGAMCVSFLSHSACALGEQERPTVRR